MSIAMTCKKREPKKTKFTCNLFLFTRSAKSNERASYVNTFVGDNIISLKLACNDDDYLGCGWEFN